MTAVTEENYRDLPSPSTIEEAKKLSIQDENGQSVLFGSLWPTAESPETRLVVFIRHFFCGACELYLQALARALSPSQHARTIIIGCGGPQLIADYRTRNALPFPFFYADPSLSLYKTFSMPTTSSPFKDGMRAPQPTYHDQGFWSVTLRSISSGLSSGLGKAAQRGPDGQNGGALLLGKEGGVEFAHRMRGIADYLEPEEAGKLLRIGRGSGGCVVCVRDMLKWPDPGPVRIWARASCYNIFLLD